MRYLSMNSRKTERGAKEFLPRLVVRAAPFALLCLPLLFASFASADEVTDRDAIRGVIATLNDATLNDSPSAAFAANSDAASELARLRQLHPADFRLIAPPEDSSVQTSNPTVVISKDPWGEARIDFSTVSARVNRSITFVEPDVALAEGAYAYRDTSAMLQTTPLLFVMRREGDGWKIAALRALAAR